MKKSLVLLLVVVICLAFSGCGDDNSSNKPAPVLAPKIESLSEIGVINTGNSANVVAAGKYLYYTGWDDRQDAFGIVDFSDPSAPVILSTIATGSTWGVAFDGRYAYVETDGGGTGIFANGTVGVIDCLEPSNPIGVIENALGHSLAYDMEISGNYLYNFSDDIIGIYDISNPQAMTHVQNISSTAAKFGKIVGKYLYIGDSVSGDLVIYDISNPTASVLEVARLAIPGGGSGATARGTTAFIAGNDMNSDVIYSVDVSDLSNPVILSSVATPSYVDYEMQVLDHYLLAVGKYDFLVIDISDPKNMTLVDSVAMGNANAWDFDVSGKYAIVGDADVLRIIQLY